MSNERLYVSVPRQLREHAKNVVDAGLFLNESDYVSTLIREDLSEAAEKLNAALQAGIDSGMSKTPSEIFFAKLKKDLASKPSAKKNSKKN